MRLEFVVVEDPKELRGKQLRELLSVLLVFLELREPPFQQPFTLKSPFVTHVVAIPLLHRTRSLLRATVEESHGPSCCAGALQDQRAAFDDPGHPRSFCPRVLSSVPVGARPPLRVSPIGIL